MSHRSQGVVFNSKHVQCESRSAARGCVYSCVEVSGRILLSYMEKGPNYLLPATPNPLHRRRVLRILVATSLPPITSLKTAEELAWQALRGIFKGYRRLYEVTGTIHRDLTTQNMRLCRDVADGKVYGVLRGFDLTVPSNKSTVKYRTRTMTYMAKDLLVADPPPHLYRHDLESFFYVLVFLTCQIPGSEPGFPPAKDDLRAMRANGSVL
ncbi:hypothetical protein B0H16DRAFT_1521190 [Mycena metata]|uniref:Protein kinase domain-containing protein n=1 Tax=Mycena metata TaxID=1033252 RepID=A0AAD7JL49_9AGAR|nr:hypothetical protein B0H16DRAFT_1521190 [Mycena metata]